MPMPTPHHKKRLSWYVLVLLWSAVLAVMVVAVGLAVNELTGRSTTCEQVLLRWDPPIRTSDADAAADRARRPFSISEPGQKVHVDADLYVDAGFLFSWSSVYLVRVGTPDDLVEEALHPYRSSADAASTGSLPGGSVPGGSVPGGSVPAPSAPPTTHPPGWSPRAIRSGDVVEVGFGRESVNEDVRLPSGDWYLAGDEVARATVLACT